MNKELMKFLRNQIWFLLLFNVFVWQMKTRNQTNTDHEQWCNFLFNDVIMVGFHKKQQIKLNTIWTRFTLKNEPSDWNIVQKHTLAW